MKTIFDIQEWKRIRGDLKDKSIGLVHTMGNLHAGHLSLCQKAKLQNEVTIVAIFINPTQFNHTEDFKCYPRTVEEDRKFLEKNKMNYLLLFDRKQIYPDDYHVQIDEVSELSRTLEGEFRPGHFRGMLTVVLKYLQIVRPTRSYYGEKDYQQLLLIQKMARAFFLETNIIGCPTIRAEDGLALSSRNSRLDPEQRYKAGLLVKSLQKNQKIEEVIEELTQHGFRVEYIFDCWERRLAAVWLGEIRLIDNIPFKNNKGS